MPRHNLTPQEQDFIDAWLNQAFAGVGGDTEWVRGDWSAIVRNCGHVVSQVEVLKRMVRVNDQPLNVGGIANVATLDGWKRQGLASKAMHKAVDFVCSTLGADFGLLVCEHQLISFYEQLGWYTVAGPVVASQSEGKIVLPEETMVYSCHDSQWPSGEIDLCGLPW